MGSKTVKADGTVDVTGKNLSTSVSTASTAVDNALKDNNATAYNKDALGNALTAAEASITKVLEDKNISKAANEVFTDLKSKLGELKKLNDAASGLKYDTANNKNDENVAKLEALKTGLEDFGTALQDAFNLTNSQMTSLDELRTTLQGFVAKPNQKTKNS